MAKRFGVNPQAAAFAGYLHDIRAIYPNQQRLVIANRLTIECHTTLRANPFMTPRLETDIDFTHKQKNGKRTRLFPSHLIYD